MKNLKRDDYDGIYDFAWFGIKLFDNVQKMRIGNFVAKIF